jgi:hypothetical protein
MHITLSLMRNRSHVRGLADEGRAGYPACCRMVPTNQEELAVLRLLQNHGGLCTRAVWREYAKRNRIKQQALQRLIRRGHIVAPQPGQLYILAEPGYRTLRAYEKRSLT